MFPAAHQTLQSVVALAFVCDWRYVSVVLGAMLAPTDEPAAGMALHLRDQFDRPAGDHQTLAAQVLLSGCLGGL